MDPNDPPPISTDLALRRLRLRYTGTCVLCGTDLAKGTDALYDAATRTVRCLDCKSNAAGTELAPVDTGAAGASAHREYQRRRVAREARVKGQLGNLIGGAALAISGEPQSIRAWERGSIGEQKLAEALEGVHGLTVLHDRRVPGTRGNIDHIVIAPAGVFVVDAKRYTGLIRIRDRGSLLKRDERLYVGRRDCSALAENMSWQMAAVKRALASAGFDASSVPVQAVLCFVDGEWPIFMPPESYRDVRLEGKRSIKKALTETQVLGPPQIERLGRMLAVAFPAK